MRCLLCGLRKRQRLTDGTPARAATPNVGGSIYRAVQEVPYAPEG